MRKHTFPNFHLIFLSGMNSKREIMGGKLCQRQTFVGDFGVSGSRRLSITEKIQSVRHSQKSSANGLLHSCFLVVRYGSKIHIKAQLVLCNF